MIAVNMHEAKTRLSELVRAVEEQGEKVILQRNGVGVAEIIPLVQAKKRVYRDLTPDPRLAVRFADGYDPAEPASEEDWPEDCR